MREFLAFSEQGALEHGLTSQQHQALLAVRSHPSGEAISISELADSLLIRNHSALGLVDRLVERGLARRWPSERDRRKVLVGLEPQGAAVLEAISRRNLRQLGETAEILAGILKTVETLGPR